MDSFRIEDAKYAHDVRYVYSVKKMCRWLGVSSSAFFDWRRRPQSATAARRERLKLLITHEFAASDETYGYRRIHAVLQRSCVPCSAELVRALMRELGLQPCQPRPWRHSLTTADDQAPALPDLVGRDFTADAPGRKLARGFHAEP